MCSNLFLQSSVLAFQGVLKHLSSKSHILWHFSDLIANKLNFFWGTQTKIQSELLRRNKNGQIRLSLIISILRHWAWTYWRGQTQHTSSRSRLWWQEGGLLRSLAIKIGLKKVSWLAIGHVPQPFSTYPPGKECSWETISTICWWCRRMRGRGNCRWNSRISLPLNTKTTWPHFKAPSGVTP